MYLDAIDLLKQLSHDARRSLVLLCPDDARRAHGDAPPAPVAPRPQHASPDIIFTSLLLLYLRQITHIHIHTHLKTPKTGVCISSKQTTYCSMEQRIYSARRIMQTTCTSVLCSAQLSKLRFRLQEQQHPGRIILHCTSMYAFRQSNHGCQKGRQVSTRENAPTN